jgi:hypothetical protein
MRKFWPYRLRQLFEHDFMAFVIARGNDLIKFPAEVVSMTRFPRPFLLGIDFFHFFDLYFCPPRSTPTSDDETEESLRNAITTFVQSLQELNIHPVFVAPGLGSTFPSFADTFLLYLSLNICNKLHFPVVRAPSSALAQLGCFSRQGAIAAILSPAEILLNDVPNWIHYIDIKTNKAIVLSSNPAILQQFLTRQSNVSAICSPFLNHKRLTWRFTPPLYERTPVYPSQQSLSLFVNELIPLPSLCKSVYLPPRCSPSFDSLSGLMAVIFGSLMRIPLTGMRFTSGFDEFLPLVLQQNPIPEEVPTGERMLSKVLSIENHVSRPFTTLFDALQKLTSQPIKPPQTVGFIITEAVRRFLTALDYIGPWGGLSAWGRAVLVANSEADGATMLFVELLRGDSIDAEVDGATGVNIGVLQVIERTFSLFPTESGKLCQGENSFGRIVRLLRIGLNHLFQLIACQVFCELGGSEPFGTFVERIPSAVVSRGPSSGGLMRFLLEATREQLDEFLGGVENKQQLRDDVRAALDWWAGLNRAVGELKQRSLKPNSRVSNLKNLLVMFECADELVRRRSDELLLIL